MSKTLVIGLDGATYDILLPLMAEGHLPQMAAVLARGSWGRLASTIPPFTAAAWSTFATGGDPGQHGILTFEKRDKFNYQPGVTGYVDAGQWQDTIWEMMGRAGKRVGVVNVPVSYPPRPVNGFLITGMMTPPNAQQFTYPPELAAELPANYAIDVAFIREGEEFRQYGLPSKEVMLAEISAVTRARSAACLQLMRAKAWDFFMVVYTGTDRINHFFWDDWQALYLGEGQGGTVDPAIRQGLLAYFQALDKDIGELIATAGEECHVVFMSDHGFGASATKRFYVNVWLEQQGLLRPKQAQSKLSLDYWRLRVGRNARLKGWLRRWLPAQTQDKLSQTAQKQVENGDIEWAGTMAYFVPIYFHVGGIELNTAVFHREGIIHDPTAYEALRDRLISQLRTVRDPQTGQLIVQEAYRREELYQGPYVSQFPDIIIVLDPDYVGMRSLAGTQLVEPHQPFRPGDHRPDGIFAIAGPHIQPQPQADLPNLHLADLSATLLYLQGVAVPDSFTGRVLQEVFDPAYWQAHPPTYTTSEMPTATANSSHGYSLDEQAELEKRLRGLGYLD
jgi:predicted AlkP superfamily phosphohydrolase/phosphomutase